LSTDQLTDLNTSPGDIETTNVSNSISSVSTHSPAINRTRNTYQSRAGQKNDVINMWQILMMKESDDMKWEIEESN